MVLLQPLLSLSLLQQLLTIPVLSLSVTSHSIISASADPFGSSNHHLHNFLLALSPAQIPLDNTWARTAGNVTESSRQNFHNDEDASKRQHELKKGRQEPIDEIPSSNAIPPQPTSSAEYNGRGMYDLSSAHKKRDGACGTQHTACSAQGFPGFCCTTIAACSRDYFGSIACCPYGAVCTGTVAAGVQQTTTIQTATTTGTAQQPTTTTNTGSPTTAGPGFIQVSGVAVATVGSMTSAALLSTTMPCQLLILSLVGIIIQVIVL